MIGDVPELTTLTDNDKPAYTMYVPLCFWFCRNNGLALPLIALQYHDVRVTMKFRDSADLVNYVGTTAPTVASLSDAYLLIDYVYLDSEERKRFAQASHEYLIEQVQFTGSESISSSTMKYRLNFNHPSKFLVWASHLDRYTSGNQFVSTDVETFAKMVWLADRVPDAYVVGNGATVTFTTADDAADQPSDPAANPAAPAALGTLAAKVNAVIVTADQADDADNAGETFTATVDNVVIVSHTISGDDMRQTVADICGDADTAARRFLRTNGVTHRDHFNYGNYIDGSDNTVVEAKLQLNGHERFQERDGH
jgi:hypothetical protein